LDKTDRHTVMPIINTTQGTCEKADQAKMNTPIGNTMPIAHAAYRRASGPRVGKCFLHRKVNAVLGRQLFDNTHWYKFSWYKFVKKPTNDPVLIAIYISSLR
jgi:hypothetical protein